MNHSNLLSLPLIYFALVALFIAPIHAQTNTANLDDDRQVFQNENPSNFWRTIAMYQGQHAAVGYPFDNRVYLFTHDSLSFPWRVRHTFYPDSFSGLFGSSLALTDQFLAILI